MEEQPRAISHATAFLMERSLMISRAVIFFFTISTIASPACFARMVLSLNTAGIVPLPGKPIPIASHRQFMEFAVYIPAHEPQPGSSAR